MLLDGTREESHVQTRLWLFRAARAAEDVPSCACKPFFGEMLIRLAHTCTALFYVLPPSRLFHLAGLIVSGRTIEGVMSAA